MQKAKGKRQRAKGKSAALAVLCLLLALSGSMRAEVTDRMLAIVNGAVITETDVLWALALDPDLKPLDLSQENKRIMLERMIDVKLLEQEAERTPQNEPTEEEITEYIREKFIRAFGSEQAFRERMQKVGLDQASLRELVRHRVEVEKYVQFRFFSFAFVRPEEVERYYNDVLLPQMKRDNNVQPLDDSLRDQIQTRLESQKANAELDRFFDETRANAQVIRLVKL